MCQCQNNFQKWGYKLKTFARLHPRGHCGLGHGSILTGLLFFKIHRHMLPSFFLFSIFCFPFFPFCVFLFTIKNILFLVIRLFILFTFSHSPLFPIFPFTHVSSFHLSLSLSLSLSLLLFFYIFFLRVSFLRSFPLFITCVSFHR